MNLFESLLLALDAILANKMRSALTTLGIIIGVSAVILLVSVGQGAKNYVTQQIRGIGSNLIFVIPGDAAQQGTQSSIDKLRLEQVKRLQREAVYAKDISGAVENRGSIKFGNKSRRANVYGVMANYIQMHNRKIVEGTAINDAHVGGSRKVAIIGKTIQDKLFGAIDPIGQRITVEGQKLVVIGVLETKGQTLGQDEDDIVMIPVSVAQRMFGMEWVSFISVEAIDELSVDLAVEETKRILKKTLEPTDFTVMTQESILGTLDQILGVLTLMLGGIAGISLLVGGIGIMNIMLVSVTERTREIGIRKAVGAKTYHILLQFVIEAATLSVIGGLIGIALGMAGTLLLRFLLPAEVPVWAVALAFLFSAGIGIFFGAYPAYKASRLSPIEALRYE